MSLKTKTFRTATKSDCLEPLILRRNDLTGLNDSNDWKGPRLLNVLARQNLQFRIGSQRPGPSAWPTSPTAHHPGSLFGFPLFRGKPGNGLMDTRLPRPFYPWTERLWAGNLAGRADWARRKPTLLLRVR